MLTQQLIYLCAASIALREYEIETDMKMPASPPIVEGNDQGVMTQVTCIKPIEPSSDE